MTLFLLGFTVVCYGISRENWHRESIRLAFRGAAGVGLLLLSITLLAGA